MLLLMTLFLGQFTQARDTGSLSNLFAPPPTVEIKKFRFRKNQKKNFERLVLEFVTKDKKEFGLPLAKTNAHPNGKETQVVLERVNLTGAIPEALINDSYVPKSKYLGPISINTDTPDNGFHIRTFLKQALLVDAFWLEHPLRLVLDVFPANSPRVEARINYEETNEQMALASKDHRDRRSDSPIVCYPISAAVSANVSFFPSANTPGAPHVDNSLNPSMAQSAGQEPVLCFLASSQVVPNVSYKARVFFDPNQYVQWQPTPPQLAPQQPSLFGNMGQKTGPGNLVVTNIPPGMTPLGTPLQKPDQVQRLPTATNTTPGSAVNLPPMGANAADGKTPASAGTGATTTSSGASKLPSISPPTK